MAEADFDLFIIGGGINGCGIARDAALRGLRVGLAEAGDLGSGTSSASTKLFHGGLRYLEFYEFELVRKALSEREVLLRMAPHISRPMRFVLPHHAGLRPWWLLRLGLFLYDRLGGRSFMPGTRTLRLGDDPAGAALRPAFTRAFEYSDGWVDDARLVALNARGAAEAGATILTRTEVTAARHDGACWRITAGGKPLRATALVNAGGPSVVRVIEGVIGQKALAKIRLVRGAHIVVPKLFDHDRAYFLQGGDGRIIFAIPYEGTFTLIGTTDVDHAGDPREAAASAAEVSYLCDFASGYFRQEISPDDVVWSFAGVRPLLDDGASSATEATRDYVLKTDAGGLPLLHVFGGKITTYRKLAEAAVAKLATHLPAMGPGQTASTPLPGGAGIAVGGAAALAAEMRAAQTWMDEANAMRIARAYGSDARAIFADGPGKALGGGLTEAEVRWQMAHEFARTTDDVIWRRTKCGLRMTKAEVAALERWITAEGGAMS